MKVLLAIVLLVGISVEAATTRKPTGVTGKYGGAYNGNSGAIASPNFPRGKYAPMSRCDYTVTVPEGKVVKDSNLQVLDRNAKWDPGDSIPYSIPLAFGIWHPDRRASDLQHNVEHRAAEDRVFMDQQLPPQDEEVNPFGEIRGIRNCAHCPEQVLTADDECPDCGRYFCSADCHSRHGCERTFD